MLGLYTEAIRDVDFTWMVSFEAALCDVIPGEEVSVGARLQ